MHELAEINKRLDLLAAAPEKIKADALFIAERNKWLARKAELTGITEAPLVPQQYTPKFQNNPTINTSSIIAAVEID